MMALRNLGRVRGASLHRRGRRTVRAWPLSSCAVGHGTPRRAVPHGSFDPLRRRSHRVTRQLRETMITSRV